MVSRDDRHLPVREVHSGNDVDRGADGGRR